MNLYAETMIVEFDDCRQVEYSVKQLDELELAYAITIHKSQGSEDPAVVMPVWPGPRMLMNRNLLYTAVTRARRCVTMVGSDDTFYQKAENINEQTRYSGLKERIWEFLIFFIRQDVRYAMKSSGGKEKSVLLVKRNSVISKNRNVKNVAKRLKSRNRNIVMTVSVLHILLTKVLRYLPMTL